MFITKKNDSFLNQKDNNKRHKNLIKLLQIQSKAKVVKKKFIEIKTESLKKLEIARNYKYKVKYSKLIKF